MSAIAIVSSLSGLYVGCRAFYGLAFPCLIGASFIAQQGIPGITDTVVSCSVAGRVSDKSTGTGWVNGGTGDTARSG
jgi:hypothetical protein